MVIWRLRSGLTPPLSCRLGSHRQGFEILDDGGEVEFVLGSAQAAQTHAFEAVMGFEMGKAHFDLFAFVA